MRSRFGHSIDPMKQRMATLLSVPDGRYVCAWAKGSTSRQGEFRPPAACRDHGCLGRFAERPLVEHLDCYTEPAKEK